MERRFRQNSNISKDQQIHCCKGLRRYHRNGHLYDLSLSLRFPPSTGLRPNEGGASLGLITLCLLGIMVKGVIMGQGQRVEILVIPVSALFAFTSLRSTMPGAPGSFGASFDHQPVVYAFETVGPPLFRCNHR